MCYSFIRYLTEYNFNILALQMVLPIDTLLSIILWFPQKSNGTVHDERFRYHMAVTAIELSYAVHFKVTVEHLVPG